MSAVFLQGPGLAVIGLYLVVLLILGWRGFRRRRAHSLRDFYLAGNSLGFMVLLFTLYASQYSGNTFLGYTGQAYRIGFAWIMSVGMLMSVVLVYLLFAPKLHELAHRHGYVTPVDWVEHRFGDRRLSTLVSLIMAVSLLNFLYAQFLAMGHVAVGLSDGHVPFWAGVVGLAVIIGLYETLGGMRSVAWTDVVQGVMLFSGLIVVLALVWPQVGSLGDVTRELMREKPQLVQTPSWTRCGNWFSSIVLLGLGAAVYPHAIQRLYAARDAATLRRSLKVMVCMPLVTTLVVFVLGIAAHGMLPEQSGLVTDRVMTELLTVLSKTGAAAQLAAVVVLAGALAAIMSTADSALLSFSSILTCDLLGRRRGTRLTEGSLARFGRWASWATIAVLVVMAISPPTTLWRLVEIKMEVLIQVAPIFIFGIRSPYLQAETAWRALSVGTTLALAALLLGIRDIGGIHAGTYACGLNALICGLGIRRARRNQLGRREVRQTAGDSVTVTPGSRSSRL